MVADTSVVSRLSDWVHGIKLPGAEKGGRIDQLRERISSLNPSGRLKGLKGRVVGFGSGLASKLKALVMKIVDFVRRHPKIFLAYGVMGAALMACGVPWHTMLVHTVPGAWYMIAFQKGDSLVSDWLKPHQAGEQADLWLPNSSSETSSPSLRRRLQELERLKEEIGSDDFFAITGKSRIGKSMALKWLAQRLADEGHPVYWLNVKQFMDNSYRGNVHRRFLMLEQHLASIQQRTGRRPILITDEYADMTQATNLAHAFKEGSAGRFTLLTAMTSNDFESLRSRDDAHANRFDLANFELQPLNGRAIKEVLGHVKASRLEAAYGVTLSDEVLRHAVDRVVREFSADKSLWLSRSLKILQRTCELVSKREENCEVTIADVEQRFQNLPARFHGREPRRDRRRER